MKKIYILIMIGLLSVACEEDFLDEAQSKSTSVVIETVDHIESLYEYHNVNSRMWGYTNAFAHDNAHMPQEILDETSSFSPEIIAHHTLGTTIDRSNDTYWRDQYRRLAVPNKGLELLKEGLLIGDDQKQIDRLIAESHYQRAAVFFDLLVEYALYPSVANENEMGIVLKRSSSFEESQVRASLKESVAGIIEEIDNALQYYPPNASKPSHWRIDISSINALAARFYLYLGDYDKAKFHSDAALSGFSTMTNYEDVVSISPYSKWWGNFVYPNTTDFGTGSPEWLEFFGDHYAYQQNENPAWNTSPSQELLDLYDDNDLRKIFFVKDWFDRYGAETNKWYAYIIWGPTTINGREGVPEMYLTRAECKAREGDFAGAMADVEMVRINRFNASDYVALPIPSSVEEAVNIVIDERRREDPFDYRFMDIKRLNNDPITDPIILTRSINGETIVIQPDNRGYARPIGDEVIELSGGQTKQNEY